MSHPKACKINEEGGIDSIGPTDTLEAIHRLYGHGHTLVDMKEETHNQLVLSTPPVQSQSVDRYHVD